MVWFGEFREREATSNTNVNTELQTGQIHIQCIPLSADKKKKPKLFPSPMAKARVLCIFFVFVLLLI